MQFARAGGWTSRVKWTMSVIIAKIKGKGIFFCIKREMKQIYTVTQTEKKSCISINLKRT